MPDFDAMDCQTLAAFIADENNPADQRAEAQLAFDGRCGSSGLGSGDNGPPPHPPGGG